MLLPKAAVLSFFLPSTAYSQSLGMRFLNGGGDVQESSDLSCYSNSCLSSVGSQRSDLIAGIDTSCAGGVVIEGTLSPVYPASEVPYSWTNSFSGVMCTVTLSNIV